MSIVDKLVIGIKRMRFRANDARRKAADAEYRAIRPGFIEQSNGRCRYCNYSSKKHNEVHHLDDDHHNNDRSNFAIACRACHPYQHIGEPSKAGDLAGEGLGSATLLAAIPEISAQDLNHLQRAIGAALLDPKEEHAARAILEHLVEERCSPAESATPKFGVAIFDNPKLRTAGWCCLPGEGPSRFSSVPELSNSAMWITSLDFDEFATKGRQHHHLRRSDYLRTSLKQIGDDLGYQLDGAFAQETSSVLATIFSRTMQIAVKVYGWKDPLQALRDGLLSEDVRRAIAAAPETKDHMVSAFESAYQSYSSPAMSSPFESNSVFVQLRRNRVHHATDVLSTLVPDEGWRFDPGAGSRSLDSWLDPDHPSLVEAT